MDNIDKILETLTLSASDTREDTLKSMAVSTLLPIPTPIAYNDFLKKVEEDFGLQLYEVEFKQILGTLVDDRKVITKDEKYIISDEHRSELRTREYKLRSNDTTRFMNFKGFVENKFKDLDKDDIRLLWQLFREYIYECFYYYGVKANQLISPKYRDKSDYIFNNTDILQALYQKVSHPALKEVLKYAVDNFANYATSEDIDFLDDLGQKTLAFASLGLDPQIAKDSFENSLIDWTLFLDTNFLFSILDLHSNVEDDACKELLKLIQQNKDYIKIEFRYTELTLVELRSKKLDFESLDNSLSRNAIGALLKSEDIDEFTKKYYTKLYNDPTHTLHPSEVIDLSNLSLQKMNIDIYRTKIMVDALGESYLNAKIQEYQRFINNLNDIRDEYAKKHGGRPFKEVFRSDHQMEHDITLREVILHRRGLLKGKEIRTMNDAKYFGVTLDELLLKYDNHEMRKSGELQYPVFFRPSFLLNKFVKILPVKTQDYKKAFIKAVSSRGFNKDIRKSRDITRIVSYLKGLGIDNEDVILNLINEQVFLERFKEESSKAEFDMNVFVESELNQLFTKTNGELEEAKARLNKVTSESQENAQENRKLALLIRDLSNHVSLYQGEMNKMHEQITKQSKLDHKDDKPSAIQTQIDFAGIEKDKRIQTLEETVGKLEIEKRENEELARAQSKKDFIRKKKRRWRNWALILFTVCIASSIFVFLEFLKIHQWNWDLTLKACKDSLVISFTVGLGAAILNTFLSKLIYDKYFNHSNIKAYEERLANRFAEIYDRRAK